MFNLVLIKNGITMTVTTVETRNETQLNILAQLTVRQPSSKELGHNH